MTILSDPHRMLRVMDVNPWRRLAEDWPGVPVVYADLGSQHRHGLTRWKRGRPVEVALNEHLTQVQRRCALAHELEHLDRGAPCETLRASIERRVLNATARYLLPDLALVADTLDVYGWHRAADELWVTFPVLVDRLKNLTDREVERVTLRREHAA
jgi:hypothetical protein